MILIFYDFFQGGRAIFKQKFPFREKGFGHALSVKNFVKSYVEAISIKFHKENLTVVLSAYTSNSDDKIKCIDCEPEGKTIKQKKLTSHTCPPCLTQSFDRNILFKFGFGTNILHLSIHIFCMKLGQEM